MAHPKGRQSKGRTLRRRGHDKVAMPQVTRDAETGTRHLSHHVNPETGMYRGKQVFDVED